MNTIQRNTGVCPIISVYKRWLGYREVSSGTFFTNLVKKCVCVLNVSWMCNLFGKI